jgi:hypothetical protein
MQSGGKLFDQGMYGCIFRPNLECEGKKKGLQTPINKEHDPLSKLILKEDAELEFDIASIIRKIPIWKNYFAVSESICKPAAKQKEKELDQCDVLTSHPLSEFRILSMSYYGQTMTNFRFDISQFQFMDFASHLIKAGALLNLFGIVHRDIHQGNILVDEHYVPRIIDFNLSIPQERPITAACLSHSYSLNISQEPPDSILVNAIYHRNPAQRVMESIIYKKKITSTISQILDYSLADMYQELLHFYQYSVSVKAGDSVTWFRMYWRTIDSWAIGINLVHLILRLSALPKFESIYASFRSTIVPLLRRMCAISPLERIDCVQALYYLDPNHFIIRKYGKVWIEKVGKPNIIPLN